MKRQNRIAIKEPDVFDILSAAWIMACNDENEIITYEGIKYRLKLSADFDVKALIQSRGELFRRGVLSNRLKEWKKEMLVGRNLPSWILEIEEPSAQKKEIEDLTPDDVFRSQFRAEKDAPRAPVGIIDWGLQHIDRLRKASLEARELSAKNRQMWMVFWVGIISMIVSLLIAWLK